MKIPSISNDQAAIAWNSMQDHGSYDASELVVDFVGADDDEQILSDVELMDLADDLLGIMDKYESAKQKNIGGIIDSEVVVPVHAALRSYAIPYQLSDIGFWRWLSNIASGGVFWKFIKWRYGSDQQVNWGITSATSLIEVYFFRAWLRGHKMYDPEQKDPYRYSKVGSSDVWRSHILRQEFGRDREFVKAFLDTIYDQNGTVLVGTRELRTKLIPALRAWTSNSTFSHLSYEENLRLIDQLRAEGI
jgi:hypothetical protein